MNISKQPELSPIFQINISLTNSEFKIDTNQLNVLISALVDADPALQDTLDNIQNNLRDVYRHTSSNFIDLLSTIFGEVKKSEIKSVSESTIYYIGGDNDD